MDWSISKQENDRNVALILEYLFIKDEAFENITLQFLI